MSRAPTRRILHIDMDAFYASVEQRDDPKLLGKPVIVGGHATRGVVLAASYEVRPFGVRSAMPMARAKQLAPQAVVVPPRFSAYAEASDRVFEIFESVTPLVEPLSLDEAFLDVTESAALFGSAWDIALSLRQRIKDELKLPASAGIAPVKFVAKIVSDLAKPDGQKEVADGEVLSFLAPLPVSRLWGVGPKTESQLHALGLRTMGDLAARGADELVRRLGPSGEHLWQLANGLDERVVVPDREAKSIGAQDTFDADTRDDDTLALQIHAQALRVGRRLRRGNLKARTVQLTIKYDDFKSLTRRVTLPAPTDDGQTLYREAVALLGKVDRARAIRLTGVSAQELVSDGGQLGLFDDGASPKRARLNEAMDRIAQKFGTAAISTADLLTTGRDGDRVDLRRAERREDDE